MQKIGLISLSVLFMASSAWANPVLSSSEVEQSISYPANNVIMKHITYKGSDAPAVGDPLGNSPVTPRDDAGPPLTRGLQFGPNCQNDACVRAEKRWDSPTNWRQDRDSGLSVGWGS